MKKNKGITLVALVITIIILIILAGITLSLVLGNEGLIAKAKNGANDYKLEAAKEQDTLATINSQFDGIITGSGTGTTNIVNVVEPTEIIYVTLYSDGTLVFSDNDTTDSEKTVSQTYTIGKTDVFESEDDIPWKNERSAITTVQFANKIVPTSTQSWFRSCSNLTTIVNIGNLDTSKTKSMRLMFAGCSNLTSIDVSKFNTSEVTDMGSMFEECIRLTSIDVSKFNTSKVTSMGWMFAQCRGLTELDVSKFDTSNVTEISGFFYNCIGIITLDLSNWDTSKVTATGCMFDGGSSGTMSLQTVDLSGKFSMASVTNTNWMFSQCRNLQHIYVGEYWDLSKVTNSDGMYFNCSARPETK